MHDFGTSVLLTVNLAIGLADKLFVRAGDWKFVTSGKRLSLSMIILVISAKEKDGNKNKPSHAKKT